MLVKQRPVIDLICEGKEVETVLKKYEDPKWKWQEKQIPQEEGWKEYSWVHLLLIPLLSYIKKKFCASRNELETSKLKSTIDMENPSRIRFSLEDQDYLTGFRHCLLLAFRTWSVIFSEKVTCRFPGGGCQEHLFP